MSNYPMVCDTCGTEGTEDDAIEIGGECQWEDCPGTIAATPRDYSVCTENEDGNHGPLRAAHDQGDISEGFVEIACDACGTTTGHKIPTAQELEWN